MKVRLKGGVFTKKNREHIAKRLSCVIEGRDMAEFGVPYMVNEGDDSYWKLNSSNDWTLGFCEESDCFTVRYRYQCEENPKEEALLEWLNQVIYPDLIEEI